MLPTFLPLVLLAPAAAPPVPRGPVVGVAVVRSADDLRAAAAYRKAPLGEASPALADQPVLDGLKGLDRSQPLGAFVRWPGVKDHPDASDLVAFAGVADRQAFLQSCRARGYTVATLPGGLL